MTMTLKAENKTEGFLFRLRRQDTPTGISNSTLASLMDLTGLSKTETAHLALRYLADELLPKYERDDGPLTEDQLQLIRSTSSASNTPEEKFTNSLF